jgi:SMI1/KNR4 family protein SUKH-1
MPWDGKSQIALIGESICGEVMSLTVEQMLVEFDGNPPSELAIIEKTERQTGFVFPADYRDFLLKQNGGEGWIGLNYAMLWRAEELAEMNKGYMFTELVPALLAIGSNGGGEAYAFDRRTAEPSLVLIPFIGMEPDVVIPIAKSFHAFLELIYTSDNLFEDSLHK